jgi:hypothetical protein
MQDSSGSRVVGKHLRTGIDVFRTQDVVDLAVARRQHAVKRGMRLREPGIKTLGSKPPICVNGPNQARGSKQSNCID